MTDGRDGRAFPAEDEESVSFMVRRLALSTLFLVLFALALKLEPKFYITEAQAAGIRAYGCPECHSASFSCHSDWRREEMAVIRDLWMKSLHAKLIKDAFFSCVSFIVKGECMHCHPNFFRRGTIRKPKYRRVFTREMPSG